MKTHSAVNFLTPKNCPSICFLRPQTPCPLGAKMMNQCKVPGSQELLARGAEGSHSPAVCLLTSIEAHRQQFVPFDFQQPRRLTVSCHFSNHPSKRRIMFKRPHCVIIQSPPYMSCRKFRGSKDLEFCFFCPIFHTVVFMFAHCGNVFVDVVPCAISKHLTITRCEHQKMVTLLLVVLRKHQLSPVELGS